MSTIFQADSIDQVALGQLYESNVIGSDGVRLGTVIDLIRQSGDVVAFEVSGGGLFGVGASHFRLPVASIVQIDGLDVYVTRDSRNLG